MKIDKLEFPKEIQTRFEKKIKQSIKMTFYNGATINVDSFNLTILEPYKVVFKSKNKVILVFITENTLTGGSRYNFFANVISKDSKHSFNNIINIINAHL